MSNISGIIKSIQNIMWQDTGLNGDAQRIEQLGWMLFLKIFSDKDKELELLDDSYTSPIPDKFHWVKEKGNWAGDDEGMTGDELLEFVDRQLFPALRNLDLSTGNQRAVIVREVFEGNNNYMKSGINIRKVLNKLNEIDFNIAKDRHAFGELYETILKDLQSAGKSGEFYTPRAITQFITDMIHPQLGEKILDPACGTGGYLTCAIEHLKKQAKNVADRKSIEQNISGWEYKPLPYLLATTNLILHDIEIPNIKFGDALDQPLSTFTEKHRVNVILANPPFGGIVANGNESNFPQTFRTKESADLFLVLMIHLLKQDGRAGIVLPDGSLSGDGIKQRVRKKLLEECNLHTIIRLPNSVFKPYATVATNLLFFEKGKSTKEIWYYQHKHSEGIKSYSKTNPIKVEEFHPIKDWWSNRSENNNAWKVSIDEIIKRDYDLDIKNPNLKQDCLVKSSKGLIEELKNDLSDINSEIEEILSSLIQIDDYEIKTIGQLCEVSKGNTGIKKSVEGEYPLVATSEERGSHNSYQFDGEAVCIPLVSSSGHGHASLKRVHYQRGKFALGSILAAATPRKDSGLSAKYLYYYLNNFKDVLLVPLMKGMANVSLSVAKIQIVKVIVPSIERQAELIYLMEKCENLREILNKSTKDADDMIKSILNEALKDISE
jgi:type I restriction enzyme M protein